MAINNIFGFTNQIARALDLRDERQGLIQSNIANIETPGYKVQDFSFKNAMESVLTDKGQLARTHFRHIALDPVSLGEAAEYTRQNRPVDLDEEMMKLSENQLMYQAATRIISKKFDGLRFVIEEGGK